MKLERLSERVWIMPFEKERDRPNLAYVRGDNWSLAVDAGHSRLHLEEFYRELSAEDLPLPAMTVLTHWHWDHTFAMHAVHGLCLANERTDRYLREFREKLDRLGPAFFLETDQTIRNEYKDDLPVIVTAADLVYRDEILLDAGSCPVRVFQAESPHTDDSSLVELPGERILFLGDAASGVFPTWEKDGALCRKLAGVIHKRDIDICVEGHADPMSKEEMEKNLTEDIVSEDND